MTLRDLPIRRKLTIGALLVSGAALALATAGWFALQIHLARQSAARDLAALGEVVAANAVGPLAFKDNAAAASLLAALQARPEIVGARLRDAAGEVFERYEPRRDGALFRAPPPGQRSCIDGFHIFVAVPVLHGGERLGLLELTTNVRDSLLELATIAGAAVIVVLGGALLVAAFLADRWQNTITGPLLALTGTAREVAASNDYTLRTAKRSNDEIGELADAFNHMLEEVHERDEALRDAQAQLSAQVEALQREIAERRRAEAELERTHRDLVEASRRAGQAEVATSVLHNVGNVLNSVGVSATLAVDRLRATRVKNVALAGQLLREHAADLAAFFRDDPKGRLFLDYLPQLAQHLETERAVVLGELDVVRKNIEHIKSIVAMQQSYARIGGVREMLRVVEVVEHALALNADSIGRHGIEIVRRYEEVPAFVVDKHRVLQILVNLISNAKNALMAASDGIARELTISVARHDGTVTISIADNGVGIAPENLTRIFQHGFTTRRDGHGFGLHSGALAAQQLGGRLTAKSAGLGQGATFTLELPMDEEPS